MGDHSALILALKSLQVKLVPLQERLRTIDEKKGTTAPHIYEKVRRETVEKIEALDREMAGHQDLARQAFAQITEQKAAITERLGKLNEELEEIRFRGSLGEFTADEAAGQEATKNDEIRRVQAGVEPLIETEAILDQFLNAVSGPVAVATLPPPPTAAPASSAPPSPTAPRPALSEMEALFGSVSPAPAGPQPISRTDPTVVPQIDDSPDRRKTAAYVPFQEREEEVPARSAANVKPFPAPAAGAPRPVLIVKTRDKDRGEDTYDLQAGATLIGRAPENDIILLEESVSRRHAKVLVEGAECSIEDLGSANGSYVNGERLRPKQPRKLQDNDVVKLGQLLALFRMHPED